MRQPQPPEAPLTRAYLHMLAQAMIFLRSGALPPAQVHDLADALHTVPEFIWPGLWTDEDFRRMYLMPYDRRWARPPESPSLVTLLDEGIRRHTTNA